MAMTDEKIEAALEGLVELLILEGATEPRRLDHEANPKPTRLERLDHLLFMANETMALPSQGRREKAMRWLGFVQGAVWEMGIRSIRDLKDDNRPDA